MDREQIDLDALAIGDPLPELRVSPDPTQMFFFSAATQNGHRIHYDHLWATEVEGYPGCLVQGTLQEALLARALSDWIGPDGRIIRFAVKNRGSAFAGDTIVCAGNVTAVESKGDRVTVELEVAASTDDGEVLMPGVATVVVARGAP